MFNHMFPNLQDDLQRDAGRKELLTIHKLQILESFSSKGALSILSALQLFIFYAFEKKDINEFSENDLVTKYINALIKFRSDLKHQKNTIVIEINTFGVIDSDDFLSDLSEYEFRKIKSLSEWHNFINKLSNYCIHSRNIRKLAGKLGFDLIKMIDQNPSPNRVKAEQARNLIRKILKTIPIEEQKRLLDASRGNKGLKYEVFKRIIVSKEFHQYFSSDKKTFANRWSEVLVEIKLNNTVSA